MKLSKEEIEETIRLRKEDFKYRLYNEAGYNEILKDAVNQARINHVAFTKQMTNQKMKR